MPLYPWQCIKKSYICDIRNYSVRYYLQLGLYSFKLQSYYSHGCTKRHPQLNNCQFQTEGITVNKANHLIDKCQRSILYEVEMMRLRDQQCGFQCTGDHHLAKQCLNRTHSQKRKSDHPRITWLWPVHTGTHIFFRLAGGMLASLQVVGKMQVYLQTSMGFVGIPSLLARH